MMSSITFGKYVPGHSILHRLDPRYKIILLIASIVFLFLTANYISLAWMLLFTVTAMILSRIPLKMYLSNLKPILPILILTSILSALYVKTGRILVEFWAIKIYSDCIERIVFMLMRILLLIILSAMLSYTTSPTSLTSAIESLLSPLRWIGLGGAVHIMAMTMTIALRFIPTLIEETAKIMNAQKARGADFESGGLIKRVKALLPVLVPLLISSVRRAEELANAMECRCYNGAVGRTRYKRLHFAGRDLAALLITAAIFACVILWNRYALVLFEVIV